MGVYYGKADFVNYGRPSLLLDFANKKSLVDRISGNNLITFSRNSTATYVGSDGLIKTASANDARFDHDPVTGESLGLLVEESRTNLTIDSEQTNAQFVQFGSVTSNATIAPDGTMTADKLLTVNGNGFGLANYWGGWDSGITYTFSIYAKKSEWNRLGVRAYDGISYFMRFTFDLNTGTTVNTEAGTLTVQKLSNDWYRLSITGTPAATASPNYRFAVECHNTALVQSEESGTGTEGIFLWGAQLEVGSFPTSYIPTTTAAVTRSADVPQITGSNLNSWFNPNEGTFIINHTWNTLDTYVAALFAVSTDGGYSGINLFDVTSLAFNTGLEFPETNNFEKITQIGSYKYGLTYNTTSRATLKNGGTVIEDANAFTSLNTVNRFSIGMERENDYQGSKTIAQISYYPTRLTNAQLQKITS